MPHRVITASRTVDGAVVWLHESGAWFGEIGRATASSDQANVSRLLAIAHADQAAGRVIDAYEVEIAPASAGNNPVRLRERIRANGPTVATD